MKKLFLFHTYDLKKIFFLLLTVFLTILLAMPALSQAPSTFSYQAVARDKNGDLLKNVSLDVRLSILQGSESGTVVWTETHSVTTNDLGLFSIPVGSVSPLDIDWNDGPYYLETEIDLKDGNGWIDMGTTGIRSVPYALQAKAVGSLQNLEIQGNDLQSDSALFIVRRKDGQPVFAVYNDGVRVYVDTSSAKGPRGGFAVGGFSPTKGEGQEYLRVTPDSVRIYINESPTKNPRGGFAIGGFTPTKSTASNLMHLDRNNYFIGHQSGLNNTSGKDNVFLGNHSGYANQTGNTNVFLGFESGYNNISGSDNVLLGYRAGHESISGKSNINIGSDAGYLNDKSNNNIFIGTKAGYNHIDGNDNNIYRADYNIFIGHQAGYGDPAGDSSNLNIFLGNKAGYSIRSGSDNVFIGDHAGYSDVTSHWNVYIGLNSGESCRGGENVFAGGASGAWADGSQNCYIGLFSGRGLPDVHNTGFGNTFYGHNSGILNSTGSHNVFLGKNAGYKNGAGNNNVYVGYGSGSQNIGSGNVFIGNKAGANDTTSTDKLIIANDSGNNLIEGDFSDKTVAIHDVLTLTPRSTVPSNPVEGMIMVWIDHHIYCYLNGSWKQLDN